MKRNAILLAFLMLSSTTFAADVEHQQMRKVEICNKLERFSLSIWSHIKDSMGEQCMTAYVPAEDAVEGKVLSSDSRWYQGSFNPTKESVTRVKRVLE